MLSDLKNLTSITFYYKLIWLLKKHWQKTTAFAFRFLDATFHRVKVILFNIN